MLVLSNMNWPPEILRFTRLLRHMFSVWSFSTENGIYEPGCGLDNVLISWGHDEYLYRVLKHNKCTIPDEGMAMIR